MPTYVLGHGEFDGGCIWRDFAPLLRSKGHEVYTPTLTGLGERKHPRTEEADLSTHNQGNFLRRLALPKGDTW